MRLKGKSIGLPSYLELRNRISAWDFTVEEGNSQDDKESTSQFPCHIHRSFIQKVLGSLCGTGLLCEFFKKNFFIECFPLPFIPLTFHFSFHHIAVYAHESFFLFAQSLHPLTLPKAVILLSIYESVPILLVSSVC